jgi:hypothetical protein
VTRTDLPESRTDRPAAATAVGILAVLGVIGSIVMTLAHLDLQIPVVSALGPTGRAIVPVAVGFAFGAVLFAVTAYGAFRRAGWAWPVALVVNGLAFASSVMPWRGIENSGVPALVTLIAIAILLSRPGRDALLYSRQRG